MVNDEAKLGATEGDISQERAPGQTETEALGKQIEELNAKAEDYLDKYRRSVAEFANYRKRQERDREQQTLRYQMDVMRKLLPVVDDFERALDNVPEGFDEHGWVEGMRLIWHKLETLLQDFGVKAIEAVGQPFDPNFHSALMQAESDSYPAGVVMEELQRGYTMADQVLRPTVVKISNGKATETSEL